MFLVPPAPLPCPSILLLVVLVLSLGLVPFMFLICSQISSSFCLRAIFLQCISLYLLVLVPVPVFVTVSVSSLLQPLVSVNVLIFIPVRRLRPASSMISQWVRSQDGREKGQSRLPESKRLRECMVRALPLLIDHMSTARILVDFILNSCGLNERSIKAEPCRTIIRAYQVRVVS